MKRAQPGGSALGAGLASLTVCIGYWLAWQATVERPCDQTGFGACSGDDVLVIVVGLPVAYVLLSLGLRVAGAPLPWACPFAVLAALVILVPLVEPLDPPASPGPSSWRA